MKNNPRLNSGDSSLILTKNKKRIQKNVQKKICENKENRIE